MGQNGGNDDDDDDRKDLTRIEDLSEFLHSNDQDVDDKFDFFDPKKDVSDLSSTAITIDEFPVSPPMEVTEEASPELQDVPEIPEEEALPDLPVEEASFEEPSLENESLRDSFSSSFSESFESEEFSESNETSEPAEFTDAPEESSAVDFSAETTNENEELENIESPLEDSFDNDNEVSGQRVEAPQVEKFQDVKTFAQNFSYGQTQGGGNPPYSIIVRHIRYDEDAEDILSLLQEFGVVTESTIAETKKALSFGSLIIPQISEYCAIILAHKLRRFDLDLEVGLSDEVHPSKSGEQNPKGLLKRDSLKQNRSESLKISDLNTSIKDIIVTTSSSAEGYQVEKYIGVQTTFSIVEEEELEKLQYVQKTFREGSDLFEYQTSDKNDQDEDMSTNKAFRDYQNSFALIYESLARELRQKAFTQKANALLGLNYQLSPLQFERNHRRISAYQITCSATLAVVMKEDA